MAAKPAQPRPSVGQADTGLACLLLVARYLGVAAEAEVIRRHFRRSGAPLTGADLVRAARWMGLRAREVERRWGRLGSVALPALAERRDGGFVLLARVGAEQVLLQDPGEPAPRVMGRAEFQALWSGRLLLCARRRAEAEGDATFGLRWFLPVVWRYRAPLAEVLLASLVLQLLGLATPLFTQVIVDKVLVHRATTTLDVLGVGMALLALFETILGGLRAWLLAHTSGRVDVELGARFFRHLVGLPLAYFAARRVGETAARAREMDAVRQFLTGAPISAVLDAAFVGVGLAVMTVYSVPLTLLVAAALPAYALLSLVATPVLRARLEAKFARGADCHAFLVETVRGVETVKALAAEGPLERRWDDLLAAHVRAGFRAAQAAAMAGQAGALLSRVTSLAVLWIGAREAMAGTLTVGELIAFNMLAARVIGPVTRLVQIWHELQQASLAVRRLADVLGTPRETSARAPWAGLPAVAGAVTFDEVHFRYRPDGPAVLRGLAFQVRRGEVVALVGPSGSGKSTVARLLGRLYLPERGRVLVDGLDVREVDPAWLRRRVAIVPQEAMLLSGSVRENLALGDVTAPLERLMAAARTAGAHDFILDLPGGYDAPVGEYGTALSGGQRQRLALARALLADPAVLVLDECTSALDWESEQAMLGRLEAMAHGRTVFLIAHRPSVVRRATRVLVIEHGRVVEDGAPGELLRAAGYYARMMRAEQGPEAGPRRAPGASG